LKNPNAVKEMAQNKKELEEKELLILSLRKVEVFFNTS